MCEYIYNKYQVDATGYLNCLKSYDIELDHKAWCDQTFWEGNIYETPFQRKQYVTPNSYMKGMKNVTPTQYLREKLNCYERKG